jgi:hypothetical protein
MLVSVAESQLELVREKLKLSTEGNERYRTRARSVATLSAAAAGALTAGLVLAPPAGIASLARVLGVLTVVLLVASTATFLLAYFVRPRTAVESVSGKGKFRALVRRVFRVWETPHTEAAEKPQEDHLKALLTTSNSMLQRILALTDIAIWMGGAAAAFLILAVVLNPILPGDDLSVAVEIRTDGTTLQYPECGAIPVRFDALAYPEDLDSASEYLPLKVDASVCRATDRDITWIYIQRSLVLVTRTGS